MTKTMPPTRSTWRQVVNSLLGLFVCFVAAQSLAQAPTGTAGQPAVQGKEAASNCPSGHYTGPRPGKARYTKDPWSWVVTPEFAKRFCMPAEFVSQELKGAEAIAYRMVQDPDEETCGWGDKPEVCLRATEHRFEIYYKNGTIPKELDVPYAHVANLPSRKLFGVSDQERKFKMQSVRKKPRVGAMGVFESQQFGLQSVANGKIAWPLGTLAQQVYYEEVFEGIDYLALEGASGFSRLEGWRKSGARQMVITAQKLGDQRRYSQTPMNEFALVITLPSKLSERLIENDQARGLNLGGLAREAFKPAPANSVKP